MRELTRAIPAAWDYSCLSVNRQKVAFFCVCSAFYTTVDITQKRLLMQALEVELVVSLVIITALHTDGL